MISGGCQEDRGNKECLSRGCPEDEGHSISLKFTLRTVGLYRPSTGLCFPHTGSPSQMSGQLEYNFGYTKTARNNSFCV